MKVSAITKISADEYSQRKNLFIRYANSFMSASEGIDPAAKAIAKNKPAKMGIETLENFTIFPKEVVEGKTVITA